MRTILRPHKRLRDVAAPIPCPAPPAKSWAVLGVNAAPLTGHRRVRDQHRAQGPASVLQLLEEGVQSN